jgi:hypothetical protein
LYGVDKGCVTHLTVLRFLLVLILKAKYGWSDCNFNDIFVSLVMFAPVAKLSSCQHIRGKKVIGQSFDEKFVYSLFLANISKLVNNLS